MIQIQQLSLVILTIATGRQLCCCLPPLV